MTELSGLQLGTLNVRTLAGRMGAVLTLASHVGLDVLLMQETRVPDLTWGAVDGAARQSWGSLPHKTASSASSPPGWVAAGW